MKGLPLDVVLAQLTHVFMLWAVPVSALAWLLMAAESRPQVRRIVGALLVAVLAAWTVACAQPVQNPCDYCTGWTCYLIGCW